MKSPPIPGSLLTIAVTALTPVIWGTTYLVTTEFLPSERPLVTAVIRTVPAGLLLILLTGSFSRTIGWGRLFLMSFLNIGAFQALLFVAAYRLPGGIAAVFGALQPLLILALAWAVDKQHPRILNIATALFGLGGMLLLFASPGDQWDPVGVAAALGGTISMGTGTFLSRRWRGEMPLLGFTGWQLTLGGGLLVPLVMLFEPPLPQLTLANWLGYTYLALFGTLIAYALWFRGIARLSPVAVSALGLLSPMTAMALGWLLLGEVMKYRELAGIFMVLASVGGLQLPEQLRSRRQYRQPALLAESAGP